MHEYCFYLKRCRILGVLGLMLLLQSAADAQVVNPKVGLCLSGGGAKGLAHIGLLKAIDSLGIRLDFIAGTSMGGVLGGLYAIGYSGKELDSLARAMDWDVLLSNKVSMDLVNIDEKDIYGRFPVELPIKGRKLELPSGIVEGHALMALLQTLTFRVANVRDFNQFPIPFRCIGGDIVNGRPVILSAGNLAYALRATMSIPTIFAPIELDGNLLVDGGLFKNFPADVLCDMGAEYLIGGYTGGKLYKKEELNSLIRIVYQSASFNRLAESSWQKQMCDILADYNDALNSAGLDAGDFKKAKEILAVGDRVTQSIMPQLQALAAAQHNAQGYCPRDRFVRDTSIWERNSHLLPSAAEASAIVDQYYGTRRFRIVNYDLVQIENGTPVLKINTLPQPRAQLNAGLHYDNILSSSVMANVTLRDMLGANSRAIIGVDVGDNLKTRVDYRIHFKHSEWWFNAFNYFENVRSPIYIGEYVYDEFLRKYTHSAFGIHRNLSRSAQMGLAFGVENASYRPVIRISDRSTPFVDGDTLIGVTQVRFSVPGLEFQYIQNTLDHPNLPSRGMRMSARARLSLGTSVFFGNEIVTNNRRIGVIERNDAVKPYVKMLFRWESVYKINRFMRIYPKFSMGARITNQKQEAQLDVTDRFFLGGFDDRNDWAFVPFVGNREGYTLQSAFSSIQLGFPILLPGNFQIIPQYGIMSGTGLNIQGKTPIIDLFNDINQSVGISLGWQTIIGPVILNVAKANNDALWRVYGSIGFRF